MNGNRLPKKSEIIDFIYIKSDYFDSKLDVIITLDNKECITKFYCNLYIIT